MTVPRLRRRTSPVRRPDRRSDMLRGAAIAIVALGTVVSGLMARGWQETIVRQRDNRLDRAASSRTATIESVMANCENALQAARSLWVASDSVSRREFNNFARSLDLPERYPGLQGIGWRSLVTDAQRDRFVARARSDGEPGFTIRPAGRRPVYYVNLFSYPRIPSSSTLGADARAVPSVLATLDEARDSGRTTVSNQTTLAGDLDLPPGERPVAFELFVPVYRHELRPDASVAERRRELAGWATGQFRTVDSWTPPWTHGPSSATWGWSCTTRPSRTAARWPAGRRGSGRKGPTCSGSGSASAAATSPCASRRCRAARS